jgi:hypothetical protein
VYAHSKKIVELNASLQTEMATKEKSPDKVRAFFSPQKK